MCGIFGIIDKKNKIKASELQKAINTVHHRGPDGEGFYIKNNIGFAHKRLSIFDLSEKGAQPMHYDDLVIVFNGAIYNFVELKEELVNYGYKFNTKTDTEVILAAYDKWGEKCVRHFNGMWAFAIHDTKNNLIFCSRDRYGIKPFYYTEIKSKFCFASEIKEFTVLEGWEARINKNTVLDFLINNYLDFNDETFFKDVYKLRKGHNLIYNIKNNTYKTYEYYSLKNKKNIKNVDFNEEKQKFLLLLSDAVKLRLRANVEVGATLSGGLDSTSIISIISALHKRNIRTVSSYFKEKDYDEEKWIDAVINKYQLQSHKISPDLDKIFEVFDELIWYQDEPFQSISIFTQFKVFELANRYNLKVLLSGQGADEILSGYEKFYFQIYKNLFKKNPFEAIKEIVLFFSKHSINPFKAINLLIKNIFVKPQHFPEWINSDIADTKLFERSSENNAQDVSVNLIYEVGLSSMLHSEDRNSMAFSIESRLPFLDYRIVEEAMSLPDNFKIRKGIRKYILREALKEILPKEVYQRYDKLGYPTPQKKWYDKNKEKIQSELKKNYKYLDKIVNDKIFSIEDDKIIWRLLSLARWIKIFDVNTKSLQ